MDLLNMLMGSMTSDSSVQALSGKTGASSSLVSGLLGAALPMLLQAMTNNASSQDGAQSLLGALSQHTSTQTMSEQIANADSADGNAIIQHIFGNNTSSVIQSLSDQSGASQDQVSSLLDNMAPAMMSGLSAAANTANQNTSGELDFSELMGAFGGSQSQNSSGLLDSLLGGSSGSSFRIDSLLGGLTEDSSEQDASSFNGSSLLSSLTNLMN